MVFCVWIPLIQTLGMLLDFWKAKNTRLAGRVFFYAFLKSHNIPRVWNRVSKHGKGISLIPPEDEYIIG